MAMDTNKYFHSWFTLPLFILLGILGAVNSYGYLLIVAIFCYVLCAGMSFEKLLEMLWPMIIISLFMGVYLGIPGNENIYLFRLIVPLYIMIHLMVGEYNLADLAAYKVPLFSLLGLFIFSVCSYSFAEYKDQVFRYSYFIFEILLIFLLSFERIKTMDDLVKVLRLVNYFFIASLFIGCIEIVLGVHLKMSSANTYVTTTIKYQPTGFFYNTNDYALFITLYYPIMMYFIKKKYHHFKQLFLYIVYTCVSLFVVISSYSRLGMLCIALNCLITAYLFYGKQVNLFLVLGFPLGVITLINIPFFSKLFNTIIVSFTEKDTSTSAREELYQRLWQICKESKFLGIGAGGAPKKMNRLELGFESASGNGYVTGHNFFLELLANLGIVGFFFFLVLIGSFIFLIIKKLSVDFTEREEIFITIEILITFLASAIALSTIIEKRFLWFALTIAFLLLQLNKKKDSDPIT